MPINKYQFLLTGLIFFHAYSLAEIKPIFSIKDPEMQKVIDKLDNKAIVVFDVDETLIIAKDKIVRKNPEKIIQNFEKTHLFDLIQNNSKKDFLASVKLKMAAHELIEPEIINFIKILQERNIKVIALTDMHAGKFYTIENMHEWRFGQLYDLGIDLSIGNQNNIVLENLPKGRTCYPTFFKGILATSRSCKKGQALVELLKQLNLKPSHVVFFDDYEYQIKSVQEEVTKLNIPCTAFHYKATEIIENNIDFEVAAFQFKYFIEHEIWLSDAQAKKLINSSCSATKLNLQ